MKCGAGGCIETVRSGDNYYILDTKDRGIGPLAVLNSVEYKERRIEAAERKNGHFMFTSIVQTETLSERELAAYANALSHPLTEDLQDGHSFTARTDGSELADINERRFSIPSNIILGYD